MTGWRKAKRRGSLGGARSGRAARSTSSASSAGRARRARRSAPRGRGRTGRRRRPRPGRAPARRPAAPRPRGARPRRCPRARRACRRRGRARASSSGLPPDCAKSRSRSRAAGTPASSASAASRSSGRRSSATRLDRVAGALAPRAAARPPGPAAAPSATSRESAGGRRTRCSSSSQRRRVGPVDVVDEQQERPAAGDQREQLAERAVQAPALGARVARRRGHTEPREAPRRAASMRSAPSPSSARRPGRAALERVDDRHERDVVLELGRAALEHDEALRRGALAQLGQQPRLADARLAADDEQAPPAARHGVERPRRSPRAPPRVPEGRPPDIGSD